jgi:hypothetical protein
VRSKSASIEAIARAFNFGIDTIAFVDDQPFERDEVRFAHPTVRCIDAAGVATITPDASPNMNRTLRPNAVRIGSPGDVRIARCLTLQIHNSSAIRTWPVD